MTTILSDNQQFCAVVEPADDGQRVTYYRSNVPGGGWRLLNVADVKLPYHAALDLAHARVQHMSRNDRHARG